MNNILNAQEAFAALRSGKTVLCRHILGEFDSLDQFPATIWVMPEHEFCIKIETIELAGITFTKPLSIEDIQPEQDVFLIQPQAVILQYKFNENIEELVTGIRSGFAQRDFENAKRQYEAICSAVGGSIFEVSLELAEQPKKKRQSKKQNDAGEIKLQTNLAANDDNSLDDIIGPVTAQIPTSNDVEKKTSTVPFEDIAAAAVTKAQEIDNQAQERQWTRFHNDKPCLDLGDKSKYEIEYADLTAVVIHAQTPDEANSVVVKTQHWTEEQRKPLLSAISKRLCELQEQSKVKPNEPPSLMVLIQNAPDLTTLDALEIDVSARHLDIQPRLMGYVKKRRFELEQPTSVSSIDEELP